MKTRELFPLPDGPDPDFLLTAVYNGAAGVWRVVRDALRGRAELPAGRAEYDTYKVLCRG
eukprot:2025643-Rhodomonas_salina.1